MTKIKKLSNFQKFYGFSFHIFDRLRQLDRLKGLTRKKYVVWYASKRDKCSFSKQKLTGIDTEKDNLLFLFIFCQSIDRLRGLEC